jgi:hypothetical protein
MLTPEITGSRSFPGDDLGGRVLIEGETPDCHTAFFIST